jgi:hypothetical protein
MVDISPPLPPRPFTPAGVKGSLNSQFLFFGPVRDFGARACDTDLRAEMGGRGSRSQWLGAWLLSFGEAKESSSANRPKPVFKKTLSNN